MERGEKKFNLLNGERKSLISGMERGEKKLNQLNGERREKARSAEWREERKSLILTAEWREVQKCSSTAVRNDLASRESQLITIYDELFRFLVGGSNILVDNKITLIGGSNDKIILVGGSTD